MENIKERISDVVHHWTAIAMITLFLFTNNSVIPKAEALIAKPEIKNEQQLKKETLEKFSNTVYKPSEMLSDIELKKLLMAVGFEGILETVPTEFFRLICWVNSALIVKKNST